MKQVQPQISKRKYTAPELQQVILDSDIALVMMSSTEPPLDPASQIPGMTEYIQKIFKFF